MNDTFKGSTLKATPKGLVSPRQAEGTLWVAEGKDTEEIALIIGCAIRTAKAHVDNAMQKLGAHNRAQLVAKAFTAGVLSPLMLCIVVSMVATSGETNLYRTRTRRVRTTSASTMTRFITPSTAGAA